MTTPTKVQNWKISRFKEYENNPRINDHAVEPLAKMIQKFGFRVPILAKSDGTLIDGHLRLKAARHLGLTTVPVLLADDMSDADIKAFRIAVNQAATLAEWDFVKLNIEVGELKLADFDISILAFDSFELKDIYSAGEPADGSADPEEAPEPPSTPVSKLGDVWILGDHRLVCGDCTVPETVALALDGGKPHLMVTDPPYGVEYDASWRKDRGVNNGGAFGAVLNDDRADWHEAWALFPGDVAYVWHAGLRANSAFDSMVAAGFEMRAQIIWAKQVLVMGRGHYHFQHEPCWYAVRKGSSGHWSGDRKQSTLWQIDKPQKSETGHSTQKPVECMRRPIENNSKPGDLVYEPFSGSGTTIIAAEISSRKCRAIELNPAYVDVAVRRWQDFSGKTAVHAETGQTFAQVASQRLKTEVAA